MPELTQTYMPPQEQPPNSALDVKLDYIKDDIKEIKGDIKEIKKDFVSRREFDEALGSIREEISPLKRFVYGIISVIGLGVIGALLQLVLRN